MYTSTTIPPHVQRSKQGRTAADLYARRIPVIGDSSVAQQLPSNPPPVQEPDYTPAPIYQEPVFLAV